MLTTQQTYTVDEFLAWIESLPENDERRHWQLMRGEILQMSPSKAVQTNSAANLLVYVGGFVLLNDLGYMTGADGGFKITEDDYYAPDAAFISKAKLPDGLPEDDFLRVVPDLVIEVVSKSDETSAHAKAMRYLEVGVRMIWVARPKTKTIEVYTPTENGALIQVVAADGVLSGGDVLPGFTLEVKEVFRK